MAFRSNNAVALLMASLAACAGTSTASSIAEVNTACGAGASHVEVRLSGFVTRVLGERGGESGTHEGFIVAASGSRFKVEDNVDITGPIPMRRGDPVELQGQYECNDGVIHWTHRDPRGRHVAGYVKVDGRVYQ